MFDTLIIGSGPAGLSAAIYASRANLRYAVIEKEKSSAGQITGTALVDNYPGIPSISGIKLGDALRNHALALGAEFCYGEVTDLTREQAPNGSPYYRVYIDGKTDEPLESKTVVYAMGAEHSHLGISGEDRLIGSGICFCSVCDGSFFEGLTVAVIGGGNSALGDALHLAGIAEKVYLIHRRDGFRASASLIEKVKRTENIELVLNAVPEEFEGEDELEAIRLADGRRIEVQGAFEAVGMQPRSELVRKFGICDGKGYIIGDENGETAIPGFYAAGDVRTKKLRQVITAAADGAAAVQSIVGYLQDC